MKKFSLNGDNGPENVPLVSLRVLPRENKQSIDSPVSLSDNSLALFSKSILGELAVIEGNLKQITIISYANKSAFTKQLRKIHTTVVEKYRNNGKEDEEKALCAKIEEIQTSLRKTPQMEKPIPSETPSTYMTFGS